MTEHSYDDESGNELDITQYLNELRDYMFRLTHDPDSVLRFLLEEREELLHDLIDELSHTSGILNTVVEDLNELRETIASGRPPTEAVVQDEQLSDAGLKGSAMRAKWRVLRDNIAGGLRSPGRVMAVLGGAAKVLGSVVTIDPRVERVVEALETARDAVEAASA